MWICPRCQTENKDSTSFCKRCGEYVAQESKQEEKASAQPSQAPPVAPRQRTQLQAQVQPQPRPPSQPLSQARPQQPRASQPLQPPPPLPLPPPVDTTPTSARPPSAPLTPPTGVAAGAAATPARKKPIINEKLLKAAQRQAEMAGETGEGEEHIDWSSASTIAGAMRTQIAQRRKSGTAMPADLKGELFGDDGAPQRANDLPRWETASPSLLGKIEAAVSKRTLLVILALSLLALAGTIIGSNSVINSFDEGVTPSLPVATLRVATVAGIWLGLDRSQGAPGTPVMYLFARPNLLILTESTASSTTPSILAEANYALRSNSLTVQPISGSASALVPDTTAIGVSGDTMKLTQPGGSGAARIQLMRPDAIRGTWQAIGGGPRYEFNANSTLTVTSAGAKPVSNGYVIAGDVLRVTPSGSTSAQDAQMWQFTFDGDNLLLYQPDPNNPTAPLNFSSPLRLVRTR